MKRKEIKKSNLNKKQQRKKLYQIGLKGLEQLKARKLLQKILFIYWTTILISRVHAIFFDNSK